MKRQLFYFFLFMCLAFPLNTTAQVVDIPDPNLRAAIEKHLARHQVPQSPQRIWQL